MAKPADRTTALWVLRRLRDAGFEALFAGGSVRDMLLKRRCSDYDIATDAQPLEVKRLFRHVLLVGAKFGVAMVIHRGRKVEVTTFRSDVSYSDGRRPDAVRFSNPQEDARRRDFTINGMFYDPIGEKVIDFVGGRADLRRRVVRTIGPPEERFAEDYLRMIRAVRFAVALDFRIDASTADAIAERAANIASISGERIFDELGKMLARESAPAAVRKLHELGLAREILPELLADETKWDEALGRLDAAAAKKDLNLSLGALLAGLTGGQIRRVLRRWGGSNDLATELCFHSKHLGDWRHAAGMPLCEFKRLMACEWFDRLRVLWKAEERRIDDAETQSRRIARRAKAIPADQIAPEPYVTGDELIAMGLREGPCLGRLLRQLYDAQLNGEITSREQARALARRFIEA